MKFAIFLALAVMISAIGAAPVFAQEKRDPFENGADEPSPAQRDASSQTSEDADDMHNNNPKDPFESDIHGEDPPLNGGLSPDNEDVN